MNKKVSADAFTDPVYRQYHIYNRDHPMFYYNHKRGASGFQQTHYPCSSSMMVRAIVRTLSLFGGKFSGKRGSTMLSLTWNLEV